MRLSPLLTGWLLLAAGAAAQAPAASAATAPRADGAPPLPTLGAFAVTPAITGSESAFLDEVAALVPRGWTVERDAFGSLIVSVPAPVAGAPAAGAAPVRKLIAVGIDEPGYVVSQIRADGWLRVHFVGRLATQQFHLAHEGRPTAVLTRGGAVAGVFVVNSVHFRSVRPDPLGEEHLFLDVGADSPADVAGLGIELLDPVSSREIVTLADGRVAGPSLGARAAAWALLGALRDMAPADAEDLAFAFVAQSLPNTGPPPNLGPLGRGGEGVARRLSPAQVLVLRPGGAASTPALAALKEAAGWSALELRTVGAGSAVESVALPDLAAFAAALAAQVRP